MASGPTEKAAQLRSDTGSGLHLGVAFVVVAMIAYAGVKWVVQGRSESPVAKPLIHRPGLLQPSEYPSTIDSAPTPRFLIGGTLAERMGVNFTGLPAGARELLANPEKAALVRQVAESMLGVGVGKMQVCLQAAGPVDFSSLKFDWTFRLHKGRITVSEGQFEGIQQGAPLTESGEVCVRAFADETFSSELATGDYPEFTAKVKYMAAIGALGEGRKD